MKKLNIKYYEILLIGNSAFINYTLYFYRKKNQIEKVSQMIYNMRNLAIFLSISSI